MLDLLFLIHIIVFAISFVIISYLNKENIIGERLFFKNLPIFAFLNYGIPFSLVIYSVFAFSTPPNYIDVFLGNIKTFFITIIYTIILFPILIKLIFNELKYGLEELKNGYLLMPFIILFLYASSVILSLTFVDMSNRAFDFSKPEERIVSVDSGSAYSKGSTSDFQLDIDPNIYNIRRINVTKRVYNEVIEIGNTMKTSNNTLVMSNNVKLKAFVYKGLYGIRYIGLRMEVLKN